jgi:hypothetical protein
MDCKISSKISQELVFALAIKNDLEKLSLVHCHLAGHAFKTLIGVIREADEIKELDLSWC